MAERGGENQSLQRARWRLGAISILLFVAGLALLVAHLVDPIAIGLTIIGFAGVASVRMAH